MPALYSFRSRLSAAALILLGGVCLAAAWKIAWGENGRNSFDSPEKIVAVLASEEFDRLTQSQQTSLALRLERCFAQHVDWEPFVEPLDSRAREKLREHFLLITRVWLKTKVDAFHARSPRAREWYVAEQINSITTWRGFEGSVEGDSRGGLESLAGPLENTAVIVLGWMNELSPEEVRRVNEFWGALENEMINRRLNPQKSRDRWEND